MPRLYVIAGHGNGDPGASGNGFDEAERVRILATKIKEHGGDQVILHDFADNAYASGALNYIDIPSDCQVVELHMDSAGSGARGAHVIYKAGFSPDDYDIALADFISGVFPGRASKLVGRSDLANVNRAAKRGFPYRLVENGFISNAEDVNIFNSRIDEIAVGYCNVFGISTTPVVPEPEPEPEPPVEPSRPTTGTANVPADPTQEELEELADLVQLGRFGNGEDRKLALGSIYDMVQNIVDVRNGKFNKVLTYQGRAVEVMEHYANHDASHGYSQYNRWGNGSNEVITLSDGTTVTISAGDRDCSSGIISAWEAVLPGSTAGATYTGNMKEEFLKTGLWEWHPMGDGYIAQPGDIYLNHVHHTAMCVSAEPDLMAQFSISENYTIHGQEGDQTGWECEIKPYSNYPWDGKLVYVGPQPGEAGSDGGDIAEPGDDSDTDYTFIVAVDGYWGMDTTTALQRYMRTEVDGEVWHQWPDNVRNNPGLTYGWKTDYTQAGSMVIRALQRKLGTDEDGIFGTVDIKTLQTYLGTYVDGRLDAPSACIKELQRRLNAGNF